MSIGRAIDAVLRELLSPICLICGNECLRNLCDPCRHFDPCENVYLNSKPLERIESVYWLNDRSKQILHRIKLSKERAWLWNFKEACRVIRPIANSTIVPVPLHWWRLSGRTFNQSEILSRWLGEYHQLPVETKWLVKHRWTNPQSKSSVSMRRKNLVGAFSCKPRKEIPKVVLLVDDVLTTGETLKACARVLSRAGVERIYGWTLFRTPPAGG